MRREALPLHRHLRHLRAHPHLLVSLLCGAAAALLLPGGQSPRTRALVGWNVAVWLYLALAAWAMLRADASRVRRVAEAQAEGAATVLVMVIVAALVSLVGTVLELSAAKQPGAPSALPHVALALSTVVGSWLLLPTVFALNYASLYFRVPPGSGLRFADDDAHSSPEFSPKFSPNFSPDFSDFLYFAFTIAVASQTADVAVGTRALRRWVLLQSVLSFVFNTAILAFTINVAASLF